MSHNPHSHRRADGTLIVRASVVALGLAASVGLQLAEPEHGGPASWATGGLSILCAVDATGSFAFQ